jgi:hypothetical protein
MIHLRPTPSAGICQVTQDAPWSNASVLGVSPKPAAGFGKNHGSTTVDRENAAQQVLLIQNGVTINIHLLY